MPENSNEYIDKIGRPDFEATPNQKPLDVYVATSFPLLKQQASD